MEERKKHRGDRKDGWWLKELPGMTKFIPHLYPNRTDNEAFLSMEIDLRPMDAYLAKKNQGITQDKYTYFHLIATAMGRAFVLRPKMNRFIAYSRVYLRKFVSLAFVVKKRFNDKSEEGVSILRFQETDTVDSFHEKLVKIIHATRREDVKDPSTSLIESLLNLPGPIMWLVMKVLFFLDRRGKLPASISDSDPSYAGCFITNLGSIGLEAGYHHLNNWGTTSCFVVVGKKHMVEGFDAEGNPDVHWSLPIGVTLDERIADGYYYSGTAALVKKLLENPELLEQPANVPVEYEIRKS